MHAQIVKPSMQIQCRVKISFDHSTASQSGVPIANLVGTASVWDSLCATGVSLRLQGAAWFHSVRIEVAIKVSSLPRL